MDFIKKYISLAGLRTEIKETTKRFRFTVIFASLLTIWLITLQNDIVRSYEAVAYSVLWTLIEGLLYSLATTIWCEYLGKKSRNTLLQLIIFALVIIDCTVLILRGGISGTGEIIARLSALLLPITAIFFIPSAPGISRMQLWSYTLRTLGMYFITYALAVILTLSILITYFIISNLFQIDFVSGVYISFIIILAGFIPFIFFLSLIPRREAIAEINKFGIATNVIGMICKNIFLPIIVTYTFILYVYTLQILITWELPTASISSMIIGVVLFPLLTLYGLQRFSFDEDSSKLSKKLTSLSRNIIPKAIVPLLVLMTVSIVYRIAEYGITAARLYILAFNIWAYGVFGYLIIKKNANFNIIPISFALAFMLVSVIPNYNFVSFSENHIRTEAINTLRNYGVENLPITEDQLKEILRTMPEDQRSTLISQVIYLNDYDDHSVISNLETSDSIFLFDELTATEVDAEEFISWGNDLSDKTKSIPSGYTEFKFYSELERDVNIDVDSIFASKSDEKEIYVTPNDSTLIIITRIVKHSTNKGQTIKYSGYEFKK